MGSQNTSITVTRVTDVTFITRFIQEIHTFSEDIVSHLLYSGDASEAFHQIALLLLITPGGVNMLINSIA